MNNSIKNDIDKWFERNFIHTEWMEGNGIFNEKDFVREIEYNNDTLDEGGYHVGSPKIKAATTLIAMMCQYCMDRN